MKMHLALGITALCMETFVATRAHAGVSYQEPAGGWRYAYEGQFNPGVDGLPDGYGRDDDTEALDGTWFHDQGDKWDGTAPGNPQLGNPGDAPGGAGSYTEGDIDYIRIQDPGNPEFHGWIQGEGTQNTNRRVYFGHDLTPDYPGGYDQLVLDNGITISFRARVPNAGPLDDLYLETGAPDVVPWIDPLVNPHGRGALMTNGRGVINVVQNNTSFFNQDNLIGFSLITSTDIADYAAGGGSGSITTGSGSGGLIMNNLAGGSPSNSIDSTQPGTLNIIEMSDESLNDWHEFWITIQGNGAAAGTHEVKVYMDGSLTPMTFNVTSAAANNAAYANYQSAFLEMGVSDNAFWGAIDIDFFAYKEGVLAPTAAPVANADFDADGDVDGADFLTWQRNFGTASGAGLTHGDADGNGAVNAADLAIWKSKFAAAPAAAAVSPVPEPASAAMACGAAATIALAVSRRRGTSQTA